MLVVWFLGQCTISSNHHDPLIHDYEVKNPSWTLAARDVIGGGLFVESCQMLVCLLAAII